MEHFEILYDGIDTQAYMLECINKSTYSIYISGWYIDLSYIIDKKNKISLYNILINKCKQGVKVYILTSIAPGTSCKYNNDKILKNKLHPNFNFKLLDMKESNYFDSIELVYNSIYNLLNNFTNMISHKKCCKRLFHQRYFLVDNKYCLINNTDLNEDKLCSLNNNIKNKNNYIWNEYSVKIKPNQEIIDYCKNNFNQNGEASLKSNIFYGNFYYENTEYNKIIKLIENSKECIFIENQWFQSHNNTVNNIINILSNKILKEKKLNNNFKIIMIIESNYMDFCNKNVIKNNFFNNIWCILKSNYYKYALYRTLYNLKLNLINYKIDIDKHLYFYTGTNDIFLHSKNWIFDHNIMLIGSSNIYDRSYQKGIDMELSILLKGDKVRETENNIVKMYNNNIDNHNNHNNDIISLLNNSNLLKRLNLKQIDNPINIIIKYSILIISIIYMNRKLIFK